MGRAVLGYSLHLSSQIQDTGSFFYAFIGKGFIMYDCTSPNFSNASHSHNTLE